MKKLFSIALLVLFAVALSSCRSCNRGDAPTAKVRVTVKDIYNTPKHGMQVCMFKDAKPAHSTHPSTAHKVVTTNRRGAATFDVNFVEHEISDGNTPIYFAVFYEHRDNGPTVACNESVVLCNGDARRIEIILPI